MRQESEQKAQAALRIRRRVSRKKNENEENPFIAAALFTSRGETKTAEGASHPKLSHNKCTTRATDDRLRELIALHAIAVRHMGLGGMSRTSWPSGNFSAHFRRFFCVWSQLRRG